MHRLLRILLILVLFGLAYPVGAESVSTRFIVDGLDRPVFLTAPPGDRERVFVAVRINKPPIRIDVR